VADELVCRKCKVEGAGDPASGALPFGWTRAREVDLLCSFCSPGPSLRIHLPLWWISKTGRAPWTPVLGIGWLVRDAGRVLGYEEAVRALRSPTPSDTMMLVYWQTEARNG